MPKTKVKQKQSEGLGGGGGKKGVGIGQSVLDLQQQVGNEQTVKTVLGPDVPGQFKAKAGRGKGGPLFFATSTYKELSKLLTSYAAKQGAKGSSWRRGQVGTMDNLLEDWFSKKKNAKKDGDKAKLEAMSWLQPKVRQEQSVLDGAKSQPTSEPQQDAPQQQDSPYTGVPAKEDEPQQQDSPYTGVPAKEEEPEPLNENAPTKDENEQDSPYTGVPAKEEPEQQTWTKGNKRLGLRGTGITMAGGRKAKQDAKNNYLPTGTSFFDNDMDDDDESEVPVVNTVIANDNVKDEDDSSIASPTVSDNDSDDDQQGGNGASKSDDLSVTSSSSDTDQPKVVEKLPDPKYSEYRTLDDHYKFEFKRGGVHLADIYNDGVKFGPDPDKIKDRVTKGWKWSPRTFDKYWHELERIFGGVTRIGPDKKPKLDKTASMDSDLLFEDVEVSDVTKEDSNGNPLTPEQIDKAKKDKRWEKGMTGWQDITVSSVSSMDSDGNTRSSSQVRSMEDAKRKQIAKEKFVGDITNSDALLVKKKTKEEERAKYMLKLGSTLTRGPANETLDTKDMASNFSGNGFGIFVMGQNGQIYVGSHKVGVFHHSSFLAGGAVAAAGEMQVSGGKLTTLTNKSGHYQPSDAHNIQVISELRDAGIQPTSYKYRIVKKDRTVEDFSSALEYANSLPYNLLEKLGWYKG